MQKNPTGKVIESETQISEDGKTLIYSEMYDFEAGEKIIERLFKRDLPLFGRKMKAANGK